MIAQFDVEPGWGTWHRVHRACRRRLWLDAPRLVTVARRVRFFEEWFCEFPLWPQWEQDADDFIAEMEFPAHLTERLRRWNAEYNEQPTGEPPHSQGPPGEWFVDFEARGRVLADEVAAFLGPDYLVEYG